MQPVAQVILKKGKEESLERFHPWLFSGAIDRVEGNLQEGDLVAVKKSDGTALGYGHCAIGSIAVRMLSFGELLPDDTFWHARIRQAYDLRRKIGLADSADTNVFRLIHGEGDGLPGLIADFYNGTVVLQAHTVGMWLERLAITRALQNVLGEKLKAVYDKSAKTIPFKAGIDATDGYLVGSAGSGIVSEYGNRFRIDWEEGQKTGFFIDQRENRKLLADYAANKSVLNMFCYTGGFSVAALRGGAMLVHSVDASVKAMDLTNEHVALNFPDYTNHASYVTDAFDFMQDIGNKYDLIVLDPPAFAKHRGSLSQALQGYKRLNAKAFRQIKPGGILFTFSCSQVVTRNNFREAVFSAAAMAGREVRILHQLSQPADHPINIYHPEGEYLKGLVLYVA